jgi:PPOX class probable F420-dependent enzyme
MSESSASATFPALADDHRRFLESQRIGYLATADAQGRPHVVPVCYAVSRNWIYITIDDKPKRTDSASLKRIRNIAENPAVAFVVDRYDDEDWSRLGWVMVRGKAEIIGAGSEHAAAQQLLRNRYPQMEAMALEKHPIIAIRIDQVTSWGDLPSQI